MVNNCHLSYLVKFAQRGGLVDVWEKAKVADALGARFALGKAWPRLVALVHHIAPILLATYHKPIALGNSPGAIFLCGRIVPTAVIAVHCTHYAVAPYRQSQRR
ncbi:hypothetical protein SDC9_153844 [bioreactor metagenome]|uniref:Uncharacterized protein n=1 Tax=bioreactor metagenome TaxID=1076179 RepID=A0A645EX16_9ZZZZ